MVQLKVSRVLYLHIDIIQFVYIVVKTFTFSFGLMLSTKKVLAIAGVLCAFMGAFIANHTYAVEDLDFTHINAHAMKNFFSPVHFAFGWNDFGWWILRLPWDDVNEVVSDGTTSIVCRKTLRWYYYNPLRWDRLWPLDKTTAESLWYADFYMTGWFYTNCEGNPYGRYGQVNYTQWGIQTSLVMWTEVNLVTNSYVPTLKFDFENFNNQTPLWYIVDSVARVGFVGGKLSRSCHDDIVMKTNWTDHINNLFEYSWEKIFLKDRPLDCILDSNGSGGLGGAASTMMSLMVQWNVSISNAMNTWDKLTVEGNFGDKTLLQTTNITMSKVLDKARVKANSLCRWKDDTTTTTLGASAAQVICLRGNANSRVTINLADITSYNGKTIIVKNKDVILEWSMPATASIDLFIDGGKLLLKNQSSMPVQSFDAKWYPQALAGVTQWILLRWNFIINGLLVGTTNWIVSDIYKHRLFLHGKLVTLNTPMAAQAGRSGHVAKVTWMVDMAWFISFQDVFKWTCDMATSKWKTDNVPCGGIADTSLSPFFIVDHEFFSRLL